MCALLLFVAFACGRDSASAACCWRGRERPDELFGRLKAEKVAPARFGSFSAADF
jgi:hypothetical protein